MGVSKFVGGDRFPDQGERLGKPVTVFFDYKTDEPFSGECIRNDTSEPGLTIFRLTNGHVVLDTECQYSH